MRRGKIDHDGLFKTLIGTFLMPFLHAFVPELAGLIDPTSIKLLDKELIHASGGKMRQQVDLLVSCQTHGSEHILLIHIETQSSARPDFPARMFAYYAALVTRYGDIIFPIALLSYHTPRIPAKHEYVIDIAGKRVLQFDFTAVQLNEFTWQKLAESQNELAMALMATLDIPQEEREEVALRFYRFLSGIAPQRNLTEIDVLTGFFEQYLQLTAREQEQVMGRLTPEEKERVMLPLSSVGKENYRRGVREGRQEGRQEGQLEGRQAGWLEGELRVLARQLKQRFPSLSAEVLSRFERLNAEQMERLSLDLFDFTSPADVSAWLNSL